MTLLVLVEFEVEDEDNARQAEDKVISELERLKFPYRFASVDIMDCERP